jgi:hypothetical protein
VVGVEQWAEIRRLYFVKRLSIKEIVRRTGATVVTRSGGRCARRRPPQYRRPPAAVEAGSVPWRPRVGVLEGGA